MGGHQQGLSCWGAKSPPVIETLEFWVGSTVFTHTQAYTYTHSSPCLCLHR